MTPYKFFKAYERSSCRKEYVACIDSSLYNATEPMCKNINSDVLLKKLEDIIKSPDAYVCSKQEGIHLRRKAVKFRNKYEDILKGENKICLFIK